MQQPYKQDLVIANGQTISGATLVANVDLDAILFPGTFTGASISFQGSPIRVETDAEPSTYYPVHDSAGALVTLTVTAGKIIPLTGDRKRAVDSCHYIKLVSASTELGARTITLIGRKRNR